VRRRRLVAASAVIASLSLAVSACSSSKNTDEQTQSNQKTTLTVGWNQYFYSYNSNTTNGNATANANILYLMTDSFNYYDAKANLQKDEKFGTYEKVSDDPLTVKYTMNADTKWSDGTPVDAADLLLEWAASSGAVNTIDAEKVKRDDATGLPKNTKGQVYFDAAAYTPGLGLSLVKDTPVVSDDGKSITLVYTKPFADWELDMSGTGAIIPAHVTAMHALGLTDAQDAKDQLVAAIQNKDKAALEKISSFWNTGYDFSALPDDPSLYLSDGAYVMKKMVENQYVTLEKNPNYHGTREPKIDELTVRWNEDPMAQVQALQNGEISMFSPQVTEDVINAAKGIPDVDVQAGVEGTYEHMDLVQNNKGPFDPASYGGDAAKAKLVRQAFLHAMPRQEVIDKLIKPIKADAEVRNSFVFVQGAPGYDEAVATNGSADYAEADPAMSKQLLQQAGVTKTIDVRVMYAKDNTRRESEFELYKPALAKAGFNLINARNADWGSKLGDGTYDAVFFGWQSTSLAVTADAATYGSQGGNNLVGYDNPTVDKAFEELAGTTDPAEQQKILQGIDKTLFDDAIGITIFQFPSATIWNKTDVTGVDSAILAPTMFYGFWKWEVPS
jgi:peptide/nickel transport system substrate-binding protein